MDYDLKQLAKLGKRRAWLLAETKKNLEGLGAEIAEARRNKVTQEKIAAVTGLSRVTVAKFEPAATDDPS
jgi:hypothetical protein